MFQFFDQTCFSLLTYWKPTGWSMSKTLFPRDRLICARITRAIVWAIQWMVKAMKDPPPSVTVKKAAQAVAVLSASLPSAEDTGAAKPLALALAFPFGFSLGVKTIQQWAACHLGPEESWHSFIWYMLHAAWWIPIGGNCRRCIYVSTSSTSYICIYIYIFIYHG